MLTSGVADSLCDVRASHGPLYPLKLPRPIVQRRTHLERETDDFRLGELGGLGLRLEICRRSVEANNGILLSAIYRAQGCVFTIDLPRHLLP